MIGGIAEVSERETAPQHSVVPINEEEFEIFLGRLRGVSEGVLTLGEWDSLLTACEHLIPQKVETSAEFTPAMRESWGPVGEKPPAERVEPVDLDLEAFGLSHNGKIIHAVLDGFSSKRTLENSQRFHVENWVRLLKRFYGLASYLSPPLYPTFTISLCSDLSNSEDSIRLANLISSAEPLVAKQKISRSVLEEWKSELHAEAVELKHQGEGFERGDDPNEFDEWHSTSKKFLATAKDFMRWGTADPINGIDELTEVLESAYRPPERDSEEDNEPQLPESGPYWTVQRLFEDL